jgi:Tfp pilus assembly protein PilO
MTSGEHGSRLLVGGGAVAALFIAALSWFMVISPLRSGAQTLRVNTAAVQTQNVALEARTATLRQQVEHRDQLVESARQALAGLPPGAQLPGFNRQLARQAHAQGVDLTSISVGASTSSAVAGAAEDQAGTLTIPVTIQTSGSVAQQLLFLHDLQQVGPRRALVSSTSVAPGQVGTSIESSSIMTVQLTVFAAPLSAEVRAQLVGVLHPGRSS